MARIPLAWKNLTHDRRRLFLAMAGIAFATVLMFQQQGFKHALFDSTVELIRWLNADLVIYQRTRFALSNEVRFPRNLLDVAASNPEVTSVTPIYIENLAARLRAPGGRAQPVRVIAWDLPRPLFVDSVAVLPEQLARLSQPKTALIDRLSRESYGFSLGADAPDEQVGELSGQQLSIVGMFQLGRDFAHEGNLLMSQENFAHYFNFRKPAPLEVVDFGILNLAAGTDALSFAQKLEQQLGPQVKVLTKQAFIAREIDFWARSTPIGIIFTIGAIMGFGVGVIICYQILANDITEHLGEFATLKAMGYPNRYFVALVVRQSLYLGVAGFIPGWLVSWGLFFVNSGLTGLLMRLTWDRIAAIFVATLVMCVLSGLLALRKLLAADPASLF